MEVEAKLLHKINVTTTGVSNRYGEKAAGTTTYSVPCYIDGRIARVLDSKGKEVQSDFSILFLPSANIGIDYTLDTGVDINGISLLPAGRIITIEEYNHPADGQVAREAFVARG
jgi:hypothetical protein